MFLILKDTRQKVLFAFSVGMCDSVDLSEATCLSFIGLAVGSVLLFAEVIPGCCQSLRKYRDI